MTKEDSPEARKSTQLATSPGVPSRSRGEYSRYWWRTSVALAEVRAKGYAVSDEDVTLGIAALGTPIFDHTGAIRAALSISGVRPAILGRDFGELCDLMIAEAGKVSALLGFGLDIAGSSATSS